jgi:hypothetical protein
MKISFIAAILSLTVSGSAFAGNNDPGPQHIVSLARIARLSSLSIQTAAAPAVNRARPGDIPLFKGLDNFLRKFPQATEVDCKVKGQLTEVNFTWNGIRLQAFYDTDGNLVATSRLIATNTLPLFVQMSLKKEYPSYLVTEAVEFIDGDDGLSYYVSVTGAKATYLLHVSTSGTISVFKKMKQ